MRSANQRTSVRSYQKEWNRLISLFTATGSDKPKTGKGAVAVIDENLKVQLRVFECDLTRNAIVVEFAKEKRTKQMTEKRQREIASADAKKHGGNAENEENLPKEETCWNEDDD
ncbi:hypothetical protein PFISCL1PPCAC_25719, partial [Pristionchus fissidentatus]